MFEVTHYFFGILAGIISLVAFVPYTLSIFKKETKPSGPSWWTWTLLTGITAFSSLAAGAPWQVLVLPFWLFVSQLFIAILSIKFGDNKWDSINKICMGMAAIAIVVWWLTGQPIIALLLSIVADLFASIPNLRHIAASPGSENKLGWKLGWLSSVMEILAVSRFSVAELAFPLYFFINMSLTLFLILRRPFIKLVS